MTLRVLSLTALLLASACSSRPAPPANQSANQAAPAPQPAPPATNTANAAAPAAAKPQAPAGDQQVAADDGADAATTEDDGDDDDLPAPRASTGCAAETSLAAARELVRICRDVSPATHPPCNIENSCAMIRSEINRGCRMLGDDAPADCRGG